MPGEGKPDFGEVVEVLNPLGDGPVVLVCEHASARIPDHLGALGLNDAARQSHAAWDPGALAVAQLLSEALNAPLVAARVSRLVYDCNRPPDLPSAMPVRSELIEVPGNVGLGAAAREERIKAVYHPFCAAVDAVLSARLERGQSTAIVTVHSFTPVYFGVKREGEIGVLHDTDSRLSDAILSRAGIIAPRIMRRNEPYGPMDDVTHSLRIYGVANGLNNVMIEIRNDLLKSPDGCARLARELLLLLQPALKDIGLITREVSADA
ncbi:MAG: N-formylglutamate amidohydrolase [Hyphomicrobiales bacterium]